MTSLDPKGLRTSTDCPERLLWAAVVASVICDLLAPDSLVTPAERRRALTWLTASSGEFARDRATTCALAGQDGDVLREKVIAILNGAPPPAFESFRGVRNVAITVEEARAMWRAQATRPSPAPKPPPPPPPPVAPTMPDETAPLTIPDDPFFPTLGKHMRASRPWLDGEVSRFLGPLPPMRSKLGRLLWEITQHSSIGRHRIAYIGDPDTLIRELADALPTCNVLWTAKGERFATYRPNAALRLYLKLPTSTSNARSDALPADVTT